jgi:hypothetical protein
LSLLFVVCFVSHQIAARAASTTHHHHHHPSTSATNSVQSTDKRTRRATSRHSAGCGDVLVGAILSRSTQPCQQVLPPLWMRMKPGGGAARLLLIHTKPHHICALAVATGPMITKPHHTCCICALQIRHSLGCYEARRGRQSRLGRIAPQICLDGRLHLGLRRYI